MTVNIFHLDNSYRKRGEKGSKMLINTVLPGVLIWLWLYNVIEEFNTYKPEVKASKSDKGFPIYGHLNFCLFPY